MSVQAGEPGSVQKIMGTTRPGVTHKVEIQDEVSGQTFEGYITGNLSLEGKMREVFLHGFGKEGSTLEGWAQFAAIAVSLGLQSEVDFCSFAVRVSQMKFEPFGPTSNPDIPWAPSVPAYICVWLALRFGDENTRAEVQKIVDGWKR